MSFPQAMNVQPQVRYVTQPATQPVLQTRVVSPVQQILAPQRQSSTSLSRSQAVPQLAGVPSVSTGLVGTQMGALHAPRLGYTVSSSVASSPPVYVSSYVAQAPMAPRAPRAPMTVASVKAQTLFPDLSEKFDNIDLNKNGVLERDEWEKEVEAHQVDQKLVHEASLESSHDTVETAATEEKVIEASPESCQMKVPAACPAEACCCAEEMPVAKSPVTEKPVAISAKKETSCFGAMCAFLPCS